MSKKENDPEALFQAFFEQKTWEIFDFQADMFRAYLYGKEGLLNAPTGSGKTMAMWLPIVIDWIKDTPNYKTIKNAGLQCLWITPLRALAKDIVKATQDAAHGLGTNWKVEARTGDTSSSVKQRQKRRMPEALVTTPESMHVLFAQKDHEKLFNHVRVVVIDEWHELLGSKRGVQTELVIAHLKAINPKLKVWGISATIGNMEEALQVLMGNSNKKGTIITSSISKKIRVQSIFPDEIERFPWSGHLGIHLVEKVLPIIENSRSTLIFTNTRNQAEIWYQCILDAQPDLAGLIALHHGSIASDLRAWVEDALHEGRLKVVVCTSSLDLGVDFRPVDSIIQVGSPKGVARFIQRAGRSGHQPGAESKIYFVPTHSLELIEASALRQATIERQIEKRVPIVHAYDVLVQYLLTLAVSDGFFAEHILDEIHQTYAYKNFPEDAFSWILDFLTTGGESLFAYPEYKKVEIEEGGKFIVNDKRIAQRHKLSIGTIVSEIVMIIKYQKGGRIGTVEESFISQINPGEVFWFAGRCLELIRIQGNEVIVKRSKNKKGKVPRWMGARMQLSSKMSSLLRENIESWLDRDQHNLEIQNLDPLFDLQQSWSLVPRQHECLIEYIQSREGYHLFIYPFEGRLIHEILGSLLAYRISRMVPITFSIAMNDYGLELLSDQAIPIQQALEEGLFSTENLSKDLPQSINNTEMAKRKFREIATISGLIFQGFPGKNVRQKHLQASASLIYKVFEEHEPNNLLFRQAYTEVLDYQVDENRLTEVLDRLNQQNICLTFPLQFTPFSFPIMVDRLRENLSSERLTDRIKRMTVQLEKQIGL